MTDLAVLRLTKLYIRRTPGVVEQIELPQLCRGVNLIYGANASGKTSTARAIEAVLWPDEVEHANLSVSAAYAIGDATYTIDLDAGRVAAQRDGIDASPLTLPAPELRERYRLSLHDLIIDDNGSFAAEIARQAAGGYDLTAAIDGLGFRDRPTQNSRESKAVNAARARVKEARDAQAKLRAEARTLEALEQQQAAARDAHARERLLALAAKHAAALAAAAEARRALETFPAGMAAIRGDEYSRLGELRKRLGAIDGNVRKAREQAEIARATAAELFPVEPPAAVVVPTLRAAVNTLAQLERDVGDSERRLSDAMQRRDEARRVIGTAVNDEQLERIDAVTIGELAAFAREAEQIRAESAAIDAELRRTGDGVAPSDLETLVVGNQLLARWLADAPSEGRPDGRVLTCLWSAAGLAVLASGVLAARWHWAFMIGVVAAIGIAILGSRPRAASRARTEREKEYGGLGLPLPDTWRVEAVQGLLDRLQRRLAEGRLAEQRVAWRDETLRRRVDLAARVQRVDEQRARLSERFGIAPGAEEWQLSWLADRVARWQDAVLAVRGANAALETARAQREQVIASVAEQLAALGYEPPTSSLDVEGAITDLERRVQEHRAAVQELSNVERRLEELYCVRGEAERECDAIFATAGTGVDDDEAVRALCAGYGPYCAARTALHDAERNREALRQELEAMPPYDTGVLELPHSVLEAERAAAADRATELEAITERVGRLRSMVERARQASDVEDALTELRAAENELVKARQNDLRAMVGNLVYRHVQQEMRDKQRPAVFHRARALFAEITRGRYRLDIVDGDEPAFRALDSETGHGHSLDQLSGATRVQLLLAVRVAFVESLEHGVRLPLLLDEVLGTSDEQRAQAIVDAVITLAEGGRQIFYFTAQWDELRKWRTALDARGLPRGEVDLAAARGREPASVPEVVSASSDIDAIPEPGSCTHEEYGVMLRVPALYPGLTPIGAIPLWYVIDDLRALHHLLALGISTWGALENLMRCGGSHYLAGFPDIYARAQGLVRALEALREEASVGQGMPIDRAVLVASEAVSARQMERVLALAKECGYRANLLLEALEEGRVSGFQQRKREELREYLERNGYFDARPARTSEEIRSAMLAAIASHVASGAVVPDDLDIILRRIERRARPSTSIPQTVGDIALQGS